MLIFLRTQKAYELAKAVYNSDLARIEKFVKADTNLLSFSIMPLRMTV